MFGDDFRQFMPERPGTVRPDKPHVPYMAFDQVLMVHMVKCIRITMEG